MHIVILLKERKEKDCGIITRIFLLPIFSMGQVKQNNEKNEGI